MFQIAIRAALIAAGLFGLGTVLAHIGDGRRWYNELGDRLAVLFGWILIAALITAGLAW